MRTAVIRSCDRDRLDRDRLDRDRLDKAGVWDLPDDGRIQGVEQRPYPACARKLRIRLDLGPRHQDKLTFLRSGMGKDELGSCRLGVAQHNYVDVERTRPPVDFTRPAMCGLDLLKRMKEIKRAHGFRNSHDDYGVQEIRLLNGSPGRCFIHRGYLAQRDTRQGSDGPHCGLKRSQPIANVSPYAQHRVVHLTSGSARPACHHAHVAERRGVLALRGGGLDSDLVWKLKADRNVHPTAEYLDDLKDVDSALNIVDAEDVTWQLGR